MRLLLASLLALPALAQDGLYRFSIDQDRLSGAPDFSFLNHPIGNADRLFVRGGHFYRAGADRQPNTADDERVRLFGVNLAFGANFPEERDAVRIAKRLRRLGVNLVRLHHLDTSPDSRPEDAGCILTTGPYPSLNPVAVSRLRKFLDALRAEGIYANLNLHVGYEFRPEADRIPPMPEGKRIPTHSKPLHIFYPRMVELQTEYTRKVIAALRLKGDPVLGMVEIDNETSLLEAWQRRALDSVLLGEYKAEFDRQLRSFLEAQGRPEGSPSGDDMLRFLTDRDRAYLRAMLRAVRESTDSLVPVAGTQMGYGGLPNLDSHADLDYQDNHFYVDHYGFPHQSWDSRDWRIRDSSAAGTGLAAYLNMAASREAGRPYTVSEYNQQWPNRQGHEIDPTLAAFGAFQDWDSIMHFAYSHGRDWDGGAPGGFDVNGDWAKWANIGQSAWLFRTAAIQPGKAAIEIPVSRELRLRFGREQRFWNITGFLTAIAGYDPAVALVHRVALRKSDTATMPQIPKPASPFRSDTGEITYDRDARLLLIHAPKVAGMFGFTGAGRKVAAGAIEMELAPSARGFAAIMVTPLDDRPLENSGRLLVSTPGYTLTVQPGSDPPRAQRMVNYAGEADWWTLEPDPAFPGKPSGSLSGRPPAWMERVESHLTLRSPAKSLSVYPLDGAGKRLAPLGEEHVQRTESGFRIHLQGEGASFSPWYEIVAER